MQMDTPHVHAAKVKGCFCLEWKKVPKAISYELERTPSDGSDAVLFTSGFGRSSMTANALEFIDSTISNMHASYQYRIRVRISSGWSDFSAYSDAFYVDLQGIEAG